LFGVVKFDELESRTVMSAGVAPFNANWHCVDCPGSILCGEQISEDNKTGDTVTTVVRVDAPWDAVMVTFSVDETVEEVAWKLAALAPAPTVTEDGTLTAELLDVSDTTVPPAGAEAVRDTAHWLVAPPTIEDGEHDSDDRDRDDGGVRVILKLFTTPL
jgi:hypothetical protein